MYLYSTRAYMTADQALSEIMHGDTESLRNSVIEESFVAKNPGKTMRPSDYKNTIYAKFSHAELANWWVTYLYYDEGCQCWHPKKTPK